MTYTSLSIGDQLRRGDECRLKTQMDREDRWFKCDTFKVITRQHLSTFQYRRPDQQNEQTTNP